MKPDQRKGNVINLNDKIDYNTRFTKFLNDLLEIENNIKEMAVNLVMSDEYSNWNRNTELGKIIELNDSILENSDDEKVIDLYALSQNINSVIPIWTVLKGRMYFIFKGDFILTLLNILVAIYLLFDYYVY